MDRWTLLRGPRGQRLYRRCATDHHHHHLVCRACGQVIEVESPWIEAWSARVGAAAGFIDVEHVIEVHGICRACHPGSGEDDTRR